jgi:tRNA threonylcarbamoyladenosine biosynthesis protein TsaB
VLGIETSSRRGTVALLDDAHVVVTLATDVPGGHGPHLLGLIDRALAGAGWTKTVLDRIAVGTGPGSFTGIRVGIALAQGIALGLGRPIVGVGSLRAMARTVPDTLVGTRCAFVDARRNEVFCAEYEPSGVELRPPTVIRGEDVPDWLARSAAPLVIGEMGAVLLSSAAGFRSELTDLPHAVGVARVGAALGAETSAADAQYVRPADAIRPNLPRFPVASGEPT